MTYAPIQGTCLVCHQDSANTSFKAGAASRDVENESLRQQLDGWIAANSPNGWIDNLRQQLVTLKTELKSIGEAIDDPRTDLTMTMSEVIIDQKQQLSAAQARIDELMLEYCPEEMTNEQIAEYEKHQRPAWRNFSLELKKEQK